MTDLSSEAASTNTVRKSRHFSSESINELLFWGAHLCVVAIALAIVWTRIDANTQALRTLVGAQNRQLELAAQQVSLAQQEAQHAQAVEAQRMVDVNTALKNIDRVLESAAKIQGDVQASLVQIREINQKMLVVADESRIAAERAANASRNAAKASSSTKALVRSRVVTSEDKVKIQQQQKALAVKKAQLSRTIQNVRKKGPTLIQKLFNQ